MQIDAFIIIPVEYDMSPLDLIDCIHDATLDEASLVDWSYQLSVYYQKNSGDYNLFIDNDAETIELLGQSADNTIDFITQFSENPQKFISSLQ
jgi:hypothetical protein